MLLAATVAFLRLTGASANHNTNGIQIASRMESWIVKETYDTNSKCQAQGLSSTQYYKLSGNCFDGGTEVTCHNDPTGVTNGILLIQSSYGGDSDCHGSPTELTSPQTSTLITEWPTYCEEEGEGYGSQVYRCLNLPTDQLPFNVEEANTLTTVGFFEPDCVMDVKNVQGARVRQINKCEVFPGEGSKKISDCGYLWEYFSDYNCQERESTTWNTYDSDFECQNDRRLESVNNDLSLGPQYRAWGSELTFCAGGNYGEYANKKSDKKKANMEVSLPDDMTFDKEVQLVLNQKFSRKNDVSSSAAASVSQEVITPMNYAYLGSFAFIGIVVGAVVTAQYFKSRNQFEGVEMQSAHSNI